MTYKDKLRTWILSGPSGETQSFDDEIVWGVWFDVNGDEYKPPFATFMNREDADEFCKGRQEFAIEPVIASFICRDNFRVPEEGK